MDRPIVLITGGNAGIGKATARSLADRACQVVIAGRQPERLAAAAASIEYKTGLPVEQLQIDLSSQASVREAAAAFQERFDRLDVLINNAGIFSNYLELTEDGFESQFAVNHLGHFLLTHLLLPSLRSAPAPRIVNVASVAHFRGMIDFDDLQGENGPETYNGLAAYAQSKLANVLFTREAARRFPDIVSNCLHPGVIRTRIANKHTKWYFSLMWELYKPFMRSTHCGAQTSVYLATSPEVREVSGRYFDERQCCRKPAALARDPELAARLWDASSRMTGLKIG